MSIEVERREAQLVKRFDAWLTANGHRIEAAEYSTGEALLRSDLVDRTSHRVWEAKGVVNRANVRMALGQLTDYLRFEPAGWTGGVLLPNEPSKDLMNLVQAGGRALAWPTHHADFVIIEPLLRGAGH